MQRPLIFALPIKNRTRRSKWLALKTQGPNQARKNVAWLDVPHLYWWHVYGDRADAGIGAQGRAANAGDNSARQAWSFRSEIPKAIFGVNTL